MSGRDIGLRPADCRPGRAQQDDAATHAAISSLRGAIDARREELRSQALTLGARLFAEKPRAVAQRLAAWWQAAHEQVGRDMSRR